MKAGIVVEAGMPPVYGDFRMPVAADGAELIRVSASALSHITRNRAAGAHYSADHALPFVVGVDGVGIRARDQRRVYFLLPVAPFGAMAQWTVVDLERTIELPDALDDVTAAAIAITGMSSHAALMERARLVTGETVLVNGATGASGRLAVQLAKYLGAAKVIATGRSELALDQLREIGADVTILLGDETALSDRLEAQFSERIDVVLDYLWGPSAEMLLVAAARGGPEGIPIRFVQIGSSGGATITLPAAALRSSSLELLGSGINSVPLHRLVHSIGEVFKAAVPHGLRIATQSVPLDGIADAWQREGRDRLVFIP